MRYKELMKELTEELQKYPHLMEMELEQVFSDVKNDKKTYKRKHGTSTPTDRYRALKLLRDHINYLLEND